MPPEEAAARLTHTHHPKQCPRVSPDGRRVVYTRIVGAYITLRVMAADGSGERALFPDREDYIQQHPCWAADGKRLVFTLSEGHRTGRIGVHACDVEETACTNFRALVPGGQNCQPAWSPDGKRLAYVAASHQLSLAAADGSGARRLGNLAGIQFYPCWSPGGEWIVFSSSHEGRFQLYGIRPDGTGLRRLSGGEGLDTHPACSPDGRWIAFTSNREGSPAIYVMRADGSDPRRVTRGADRDEYPGWAPDSRALLFVSTRGGGFDLYRAELPAAG